MEGGWGSGYIQHVELAEVGVNEPSVLEHLPHVLHHLQVELAGLGLRQRGVL